MTVCVSLPLCAAALEILQNFVPGRDPTVWRADAYGNLIKRWEQGNTASEHGWRVDEIKPVSLGGAPDISNLRPLACRAHPSLGAGISR